MASAVCVCVLPIAHTDVSRELPATALRPSQAVKFDGWARVLLLPARSKKRPAVCRYVPPGAEEVQDDPKEAEVMMMLLDRAMNMKEVCVQHTEWARLSGRCHGSECAVASARFQRPM